MNKKNYIYFLSVARKGDEAESAISIKIGETAELKKRLKEHAKRKHGVEFSVDPMCIVVGDRSSEQQIHRHFQRFLLDGEVETYRPSEELCGYVRWLREQCFSWASDSDCGKVEELEAVEPSLWMPNGERSIDPPKRGLFDLHPLGMPPRQTTPDDFYTDASIIESAREAMGGIDLDPASHAVANAVVKAKVFFSIGYDGLSHKWSGRVWINPPFSMWSVWVPKLITELQTGRVTEACVLVATRTLTAKYFAPMHAHADAFCILNGRIPFWGERATTPDDGHAIMYFGPNIERFESAFRNLGTTYFSATKRL